MPHNGEVEQEVDRRWLVEVVAVPGALAYGATRDEAVTRTEVVAIWAMADRLASGESGDRPGDF